MLNSYYRLQKEENCEIVLVNCRRPRKRTKKNPASQNQATPGLGKSRSGFTSHYLGITQRLQGNGYIVPYLPLEEPKEEGMRNQPKQELGPTITIESEERDEEAPNPLDNSIIFEVFSR